MTAVALVDSTANHTVNDILQRAIGAVEAALPDQVRAYFLAAYKDFVLDELRTGDTNAKLLAVQTLRALPYQDEDIALMVAQQVE